MTHRGFILFLAVSLGVTWLSAMGFSGQSRSRKRARVAARVEPPQAEPKLLVPGHEPDWSPPGQEHRPKRPVLRVVAHPQAKGQMRALHDQAARLISAANLPSVHRSNHFNWVNEREGHEITGWGGMVEQVEEMPAGYQVTVRVTPTITVHGGSGTVMSDYVLEHYTIANGQVRFVQGIDPPDAVPGGILTD